MKDDFTERNPILARWRQIIGHNGDAAALFSAEGEVLRTFADLDRESDEIAGGSLDFPAGSVVALRLPNCVHWPAFYLAGLKRGLILLPMDASLSEASTDAILNACGASACVVLEHEMPIVKKWNAPRIDWGRKQPEFLKTTSGTTSTPRVILFLHAQILADCDQICETMGLAPEDRNYGVVAFSHSYGFSNLITPLICRGIALVVVGDMIPQAVVNGLQGSHATILPGVPPLFHALFKLGESLPRTLRLCVSAGAPLPQDVAWGFQDIQGRTIHSFYGSSECGGICYDASEEKVPAGFVGQAMRGVHLKKWDAGNEESQYRVSSAAVGMRYLSEDAALHNGFFLPSDLLMQTAEGYRIVGRLSDLINVGGRKVNPQEVETAIRQMPGITECVVFGVQDNVKTEAIHACVVQDGAFAAQDVRSHCGKVLAAWQIPREIHFVDEIPRTARGKISRTELARRFCSP